MKIILYTTPDENIKLNKELNNSLELTGTLRAECSVLNPVLEIQSTVNISTFNYAYIEDFNRYYYITDIVAVHSKLWKISLKVDVLMSYASDIIQLECTIARNEYDFNQMLDDKLLSRYADNRVQTFNFPVSLTSTAINQFKYYLTLIGGGGN